MRAHDALKHVLAHKDCPACGGSGYIPHGTLIPLSCDGCNGSGIKSEPLIGALVMPAVFVLTVVLPVWLWLR
jgi:DnaJ-class molecular chaperone